MSTNGEIDLASAPSPEPVPEMADDFKHGFDGMATAAFDAKITAILSAPIDPEEVEIKPDGIVYLPGAFYRKRLFEAFGPGGWALVKRAPFKSRQQGAGTLVMYEGALYAHGRFIAEAAGQCTYFSSNRGMTHVDAIEGAKTDCLTRCCKDIMPGALCLWDPGWREQWQAKYARQEKNSKGEMVWKRRGREQKLAPAIIGATPSVAAPNPPHASHADVAPSAAAAEGATSICDDGEAVTEEQLDELERMVFRDLGWRKSFAAAWLKEHFGLSDPAALTRDQLRTAYELLFAFGPPPNAPSERYKPLLEKLRSEGRCK